MLGYSSTSPVQRGACRSRHIGPGFAALPQCLNCIKSGPVANCRFAGFRIVLTDGKEDFLSPDNGLRPRFTWVYNRKLTLGAITSTKLACATYIAPVLSRELAHCSNPRTIYRVRELDCRVICDVCSSELFACTWMCPSCGLELCGECVEDMATEKLGGHLRCESQPHILHTPAHLRPLTRFSSSELSVALRHMSLLSASCSGHSSRGDVARLQYGKFSMPEFLDLWQTGVPVVIGEVDKHLQGRWTPEDFISDYGAQKVMVIDYTNGNEKHRRSTVEEFFRALASSDGCDRALKLKDWPPQKDFRTSFPHLYDAFCSSVPCPDLVCPNGILNLASHFPRSCMPPDLGPKMYIALAAKFDNGTTNLHLDITDAVNMMVWSKHKGNISAVWEIFPRDSVPQLREFMRGEFGPSEVMDPIHSQAYYLGEDALVRLADKFDVRPWRVLQRVGDVVFIPAGCPHQVRNVEDAIKVACDFVSAANLHATRQLVPSLRAHRLVRKVDDVLQLDTTLWYAWCSVSAYKDPVEEGNESRLLPVVDSLCSESPDSGCHESRGVDPFQLCSGSPEFRGSVDDTAGDTTGALPELSMLATAGEPFAASGGDSTRGICATGRLDARKSKRRSLKVAQAYGERPSKPTHTYPCPHPRCHGVFNRGGLLDHMKIWHADVYGLSPELEKRVRKESLYGVGRFWEVLRSTYRIPPEQGALLCQE